MQQLTHHVFLCYYEGYGYYNLNKWIKTITQDTTTSELGLGEVHG